MELFLRRKAKQSKLDVLLDLSNVAPRIEKMLGWLGKEANTRCKTELQGRARQA